MSARTLPYQLTRAAVGVLLAVGTAAAAAAQAASPAPAPAATTFFRNVRVFDGAKAIEGQDVLVERGRIARVGRALKAPTGATVVDGTGRTLLPGFIDSHTHVWPGSLEGAIHFGVTTELDMFSDVAASRAARAEQLAGRATGRADLRSAGTLVTAPKGHGTEYGMTIPTITGPSEAAAFVDARIAEGSDYIKIVYDDGHTYGMSLPTLDRATMRAVIAAAHARGKLALVHIGDLEGARAAIEEGADGLVHLFVDKAPDADFAKLVAQHRAFVIPTLSVLRSIAGSTSGAVLADDPRLTPWLTRTDVSMLKQGFPRRPGAPATAYAGAVETVRALHAAGVPVLAGTDAGNPGTTHGASLHGELSLLVEAGLSPSEALAAATSVPARHFKLADRGRIAAGLRADLVLVDGDPTTDVSATRAIVGVWKEGVALDRPAQAARIASAREAASRAPEGSASGRVSDFDAGTLATSFGAGWAISTDAMAGGGSTATMQVVDGGAEGTTHALEIRGTIDAKLPFAWAGAMFTPGAQMMTPVNLSSKKEIAFRAKGDGRTYRLMLFAESKGMQPLSKSFVAGAEWKEFTFPISAFAGSDGRDLMALIFAAGPAAGGFELRIDDVRIR